MKWLDNIIEKLNPAQSDIVMDQGEDHYSTKRDYDVTRAYESLEVLNRGVNLVVDSAADINVDIKKRINGLGEGDNISSIRPERLGILLNRKPNPYQDAGTFKRNIFLDLILEGNIFIYFDGAHMYQLPAINVKVKADKITHINHYAYDNKKFYPHEIIHVKDNSARSIYRGDSRLKTTIGSINALHEMERYQTKFFKNNAVLGLVLKTPNALSQRVKDRLIARWMQMYNPASGGRRPAILDGGMELESLGDGNFRELDFQESILTQEKQILKALGVPPILLDSGNNANITPNLRMFYITTIVPIINSYVRVLEYYFGYDLKPALGEVMALQPDLKDLGNYHTGLTNNGLETINEGRDALRLPRSDNPMADELIKPQNIAGSATDPSQGGKPKETKKDE